MPTNVSTPIWACDVCRTRHDGRLDVAQACEASPVPEAASVRLSVRGGSYHLVRLTDPALRTRTSPWRMTEGHYWQYKVEDTGDSYHIDGDAMLPGTAGRLQVDRGGRGTLWSRGGLVPAQVGFTDLAAAVGLPTNGHDVPSASGGRWVGPLTPGVREVLEALGAELVVDRRLAVDGNRWARESLVSTVLHATEPSAPAARAAFRTRDHSAIIAAVIASWQQWWAGEQVTVPAPPVRARSARTPSKLTKELRTLVETIGVPWQARTDASDYVNTVTNLKLGVSMPTENRLFAGTPVVAVGGVRGGVGKSTVARWLAQGLAERGERVLLLDLDVASPSQHLAFGLDGGVRIDDELLRMVPEPVAPNMSVFSVGQLGPGTALPARWGENDITAFIDFVGATLDVSNVDRIVADLPAGNGVERSLVTNSHRVNLGAELVVTTADPHALAAARTTLHRAHHEYHPRLLVENMATATGLSPEGLSVTVRLRGDGTEVPALAEEADVPFLGALPWVTDGAPTQQMNTIIDTLDPAASAR